MRARLLSTFTVIGVVAVLLLAGNTIALAATGNALILGKSNSANNITAVTRTTAGTGLKITTAKSYNAPLAVNGKGKVANLNADKVDGIDAAALRTRSYHFTGSVTDAFDATFELPVPNGTYLISYSNYFDQATDTPVICLIIETKPPSTIRYTGISQFNATTSASGAISPGVSGSGLATKTTGGSIVVSCEIQDGTFSSVPNAPMEIVATPTTVVSSRTLTPQ